MAEENRGTMNLDLNLGPLENPNDGNAPESGSYFHVTMNLEDYLDDQARMDIIRHSRQRLRSLRRQFQFPPETRNLAISGNTQQTGEGSIGSNERSTDLLKTVEKGNDFSKIEALEKKDDLGKNNIDEGSFFDCNICLDLAKDPIVTCCGHLFCWPCIYRWLNHHSDAKECPICKGEVTIKNVTPIYGRGNNNNNKRALELDYTSLKIPVRPQARRIESWRQTIQRSALGIPLDEMIRLLESGVDLRHELAHTQSDGRNSLPNRVLTSRGLREERQVAPPEPSDDVIALARTREIVRAESPQFTSVMNSGGTIDTSYFDDLSDDEVNEGIGLPYDDLDSLTRIAAVIHSESQTVDNSVEMDPSVYRSTLSSSRRNNGSRMSDVNSGNSHANRRRRLN